MISLVCKNLQSGNFQTMKAYIQREEDFRPMYSHENFKNVSFEIIWGYKYKRFLVLSRYGRSRKSPDWRIGEKNSNE